MKKRVLNFLKNYQENWIKPDKLRLLFNRRNKNTNLFEKKTEQWKQHFNI